MRSLFLVAALALVTPAAQAQAVSERTKTFANGSTFNTKVQTTTAQNTRTRVTTGVGSDGRGFDRTAVWQWDPATKSWKKTVIGETANGTAWTNNGGGSCANGTCTSSSTYTGTNGISATRQSSTVRENGLTSRRTERTTRRGTATRVWKRLR